MVLDCYRDGERPVWWTERRALCWDLPTELVEEAAFDFLVRNGDTLDDLEADCPRHDAVCDLIHDPDAPAGIPFLGHISDQQIEKVNKQREAQVTRRDAAYWIARERIAGVDNGMSVEALAPAPRLTPPPAQRLMARRRPGAVTRRRAPRRRVRRSARAPDRPRLGDSRPRPRAGRQLSRRSA